VLGTLKALKLSILLLKS
jgi:hypothetical protein